METYAATFMNSLTRLSILAALMLSGCTSQAFLVYESKGDKQCYANTGKTIRDSAATLKDEGVDVLKSECAIKSGMVMSMCGAPTLNILIHHIDANGAEKAKSLGFEAASRLNVEGEEPGYQIVSCD